MNEEEQIVYDSILSMGGRSYSGRFMFGKKCLSLITEGQYQSCQDLVSKVIDNIKIDDAQTFRSCFKICMNYKEDSLGLGSVIYWPNLEFNEADEDDE